MADSGHEPVASRRQAFRLLRPHLVPLAAMALAADRIMSQLTDAMLRESRRHRYEPKIRGTLVAVMWGEGVREWVAEVKPPNVRLFTPYDWTELIIGTLHVRIQRDNAKPVNERRRLRHEQLPDPMLPFPVEHRTPTGITNIDVSAELTGDGRIRAVRATAPLKKGFVWTPIDVDLSDALHLLYSWQLRKVPWLATVERCGELARLDGVVDELAALRAHVEALRRKALAEQVGDIGMPDVQGGRAQFRVPPRIRRDAAGS